MTREQQLLIDYLELDRLELGYRAAVYLRFENADGLRRFLQEVGR